MCLMIDGQAVIGKFTWPSAEEEELEPFGKLMDAPELLPLLMQALPFASWEARSVVMKVCAHRRRVDWMQLAWCMYRGVPKFWTH